MDFKPSINLKFFCKIAVLSSMTFVDAYLYAQNSIESKKEERYKSTIDHYNKLIEIFPATEYKKEASRILSAAEEKLKDYHTVN